MSCDKWAYDPKRCDDQICPGDCDNCRFLTSALMVAADMSELMRHARVKNVPFSDDTDSEEEQAILALRKGEE